MINTLEFTKLHVLNNLKECSGLSGSRVQDYVGVYIAEAGVAYDTILKSFGLLKETEDAD
jgi:hypothetical protein